jgi:hypothetical protein
VLEPHVGAGGFANALYPRVGERLYVNDLDQVGCARQAQIRLNQRRCGDFLSLRAPFGFFRWIIGNPPYADAEAHVRKALALAPNVAFLMRLQWMGSLERYPFWSEFRPAQVFVLVPRPSFTGGGTDRAQEYAFFIWHREDPSDLVAPTALYWLQWRARLR